MAELTPEHFESLSGETFVLSLPDGTRLDVGLWKVRVTSLHVPRGFRRPFAVEFRRLGQGPEAQGTYRLEHPSLGAMALFLTPVQPGSQSSPEARHYEAVFG